MDIDKKLVARRLANVRTHIVATSPFFSNLVLHLKISLANCETAATDMRSIIFDPRFVMRLSDAELEFLFKHELMHCALFHCLRGRKLNQFIFNVACDIVVNSNILNGMGVKTFKVDGEEVMHLAPDGKEGCTYSAEEVYAMLMDKYGTRVDEVDDLLDELEREFGVSIDSHDIWKIIPLDGELADDWKENIKKAVASLGDGNWYPPSAQRVLDDIERESKVDWRVVLNDFIREVHDRYDYLFVPPDRRFSTGDFILPSFAEMTDEKVEDLWFLIDTSGSISNEELAEAYSEIKSAISQFEYLQGKLSFFDTSVSEPVSFDNASSLKDAAKPVGGGGTSFHAIFEYMAEHMSDKLPTAVIILTDGYAPYPSEEATLGVPVLWIIAGDNKQDAPWGKVVRV